MSEMTLITKRYGHISEFTSKVNKSVIVFKKKSLLAEASSREKYPLLQVNETELTQAKENLLESLADLEKLSSNTEFSIKLIGISDSSSLRDLIVKNETDRREIESIIVSLKETTPLTKSNFLMLDKIISILDSERNLLFRKLRTARG